MWILKLIYIVFDQLISHHFKKLLTGVEIHKNIHQNIHDLYQGFVDDLTHLTVGDPTNSSI